MSGKRRSTADMMSHYSNFYSTPQTTVSSQTAWSQVDEDSSTAAELPTPDTTVHVEGGEQPAATVEEPVSQSAKSSADKVELNDVAVHRPSRIRRRRVPPTTTALLASARMVVTDVSREDAGSAAFENAVKFLTLLSDADTRADLSAEAVCAIVSLGSNLLRSYEGRLVLSIALYELFIDEGARQHVDNVATQILIRLLADARPTATALPSVWSPTALQGATGMALIRSLCPYTQLSPCVVSALTLQSFCASPKAATVMLGHRVFTAFAASLAALAARAGPTVSTAALLAQVCEKMCMEFPSCRTVMSVAVPALCKGAYALLNAGQSPLVARASQLPDGDTAAPHGSGVVTLEADAAAYATQFLAALINICHGNATACELLGRNGGRVLCSLLSAAVGTVDADCAVLGLIVNVLEVTESTDLATAIVQHPLGEEGSVLEYLAEHVGRLVDGECEVDERESALAFTSGLLLSVLVLCKLENEVAEALPFPVARLGKLLYMHAKLLSDGGMLTASVRQSFARVGAALAECKGV